MELRFETLGDEDAIYNLTKTAFLDLAVSDGREADIINALRLDGDLTLSLIAEDEGQLIGHIAFSPVIIDGIDGTWFGLGPVSVKSEYRRRGIAKALIKSGLEKLKRSGAFGVVLIGNPDVYGGSGFVSDGCLTYGDLDPRFVQYVAFGENRPSGEITYSAGFSAGL